MQHDVREVIRTRVRAASRRIEQNDTIATGGRWFSLLWLASTSKYCARGARRIAEVRQERLIPDDQIRVVSRTNRTTVRAYSSSGLLQRRKTTRL